MRIVWKQIKKKTLKKLSLLPIDLLEKGKTSGQAIHMVQNPVKVYEEEKAANKAVETAKEPEHPPPRKKSVAEKGSAKGSSFFLLLFLFLPLSKK